MVGNRKNFGMSLRDEYEKAMSEADGKNLYIGKFAEGIRNRLDKDVARSKTVMDDLLKNFQKYQKPIFWRNDVVRGNSNSGYVGKTRDGIKVCKKDFSKGGRMFIGRYCYAKTGKSYVVLFGYVLSQDHDEWETEKNRISREVGVDFNIDEEDYEDEIDNIGDGSIIIDQSSFYLPHRDGELTEYKLSQLVHDANITPTLKQFETIGRRPPLLIDGHAGSGKSIILALRIAFLFQDYEKHFKTKRDPPRLLVVAYNQRVLNMIEKYVVYWMEHFLEGHEQYIDNVDYIPTMGLYHSLVKKVDYENIPDPMLERADQKFVSFYKFETEFFTDKFHSQDISAEQAWHFIRGILKGQGYGWYGTSKVSITDFASVNPEGKIPRKLTEFMSEDLLQNLLGVFHRYESWRHEKGLIDDIDLVRRAFTAIRAEKQIDEPFRGDRLNRYDELFVDEAQDLTSKEFELLTYLLKGNKTRIVVGGDPLQTINPTGFSWNSLETFLFTLVSGDEVSRSERMLVSHRLPKKLVDFSNVIIRSRSEVKDGNLDLMEAADKVREDGFIAKVSYNEADEEERKYIEEILTESLSSNTGILLWARDSAELKEKTDNDSILATGKEYEQQIFDTHSIESVKGLEYDTIILYRFGDLDETFNDLSSTSLNIGEKGEIETSEMYKVLYHLNRLFIAASRAKKNIYIIDGKESIDSAWSERLWGATIEHTLTVQNLREQIDLTPSLDKSRNYYQKGREDRNLELLRKALASAIPCPNSDEKDKLIRDIRITILRMEIDSTSPKNKDIITVKQTQLVNLYEEVGRIGEAIALRAEMGDWEFIYQNYGREEGMTNKLFWLFSKLDTRYDGAVKALQLILNQPGNWGHLKTEHSLLARKSLRPRLREFAKQKMDKLGFHDLGVLSEHFGFRPDDFMDLLKPIWDQSSGRRVETNKETLKDFTAKISYISPEKNVEKLADSQYIKFLKITLECPTLSQDEEASKIDHLSQRGDLSGAARTVARLVFGKDLHLLHHDWERVLTTLEKQDVDPKLQSDYDRLISRLKTLNAIKSEYTSALAQLDMGNLKKACASYAILQKSIDVSSGMPFFMGGTLDGRKYEKSEVYLAFKEKLLSIEQRDLTALGKKWITMYSVKQNRLDGMMNRPAFTELLQLFKDDCTKELVILVEKVLRRWDRAKPYDSEIINGMLSFVDAENRTHLQKDRDYVRNVEKYVSITGQWNLLYEKQVVPTIHPWTRKMFSEKYQDIANLCVWFRKGEWLTWKEEKESIDLLKAFFGLAQKASIPAIEQALSAKLGQKNIDPAPSKILRFAYPEVATRKAKDIQSILSEYTEMARGNINWLNAGYFTSKSIPVDKSKLKILKEVKKTGKVEDVDIFLIGTNITKSFTQLVVFEYKNFGTQTLPLAIKNPLIKDQITGLKGQAQLLTGKSEFWEHASRSESFVESFIAHKADNGTLAIGALLETLIVWRELTNKRRIEYLKNLDITIKPSALHNEVVECLMNQEFVKKAIESIDYKPNHKDMSQLIRELLKK